jgi:hypothetical protein
MLHYRCTAIGILFPLGNRAIASGLSIGLCWMMFPAKRGTSLINLFFDSLLALYPFLVDVWVSPLRGETHTSTPVN